MVRSGTTNTCFLHRVTIFSTCIFLLQKRYQSHNNLFSPVQDLFNLKIVAFSANKPKQTKCSIKRKKALEYQGLFCFTVFSYCKYGGATRNRTGDKGFADPCLTAWPWRLIKLTNADANESHPHCSGADYGARTRHLRLGKATLYQMS